jgi:hypothetical protein
MGDAQPLPVTFHLELVVDLEETELAEARRGLIPGYEEKRERAASGWQTGRIG